ncbi:MAG TPA: NAD(P)-binding protein [Chryseolinea sp.]
MRSTASLPVAIIGAGPVGLAAAAHLVLRNQPFVMFEAGHTVASNIMTWKQSRSSKPRRRSSVQVTLAGHDLP